MKPTTVASLLALSLTACSGSSAEPEGDDVGDDDVGDDDVGEPDAAPPLPAGYDIVLIAGQSNAVGIGRGPEVELAAGEMLLAERIDQLGRYREDDGEIVRAIEPLAHWSNDPIETAGAADRRGFGYPFALELAAQTPSQRRILLVPTALGGTSILQWNDVGGEYGAGDTTILIDDMRERAARALAAELEPGAENRLVAILWHQGESDINAALNPASAIGAVMTSPARYQTELETLLAGFRTTFADQGCVPLMMGEVVPSWVPNATGGAAMRDQFMQVIHDVSAATPCTAVVESDGLTSNAEDLGTTDTIHFSAASMKVFGRRYFEAYERLRAAATDAD